MPQSSSTITLWGTLCAGVREDDDGLQGSLIDLEGHLLLEVRPRTRAPSCFFGEQMSVDEPEEEGAALLVEVSTGSLRDYRVKLKLVVDDAPRKAGG
jgi:hypothetical protein